MNKSSNIKSKILLSIFIILFFLIISFFCGDEYISFHQQILQNEINNEKVEENVKAFSLDKIKKIENIEFKYTPDKKVLDLIVSKIDNAQNRVYVEVYIFTEKRIREALIKANDRGLDVKVVLESKPYMAPSLNNNTFNYLKKSGVNVVWSNPQNFSLNHSKMIIIDNDVVLSTGNFSYSNFIYNRDLFLFIKDNKILSILLNIFDNDFNGENKVFYNDNLILSPSYSRYKLEYVLKSAKNEIKMYFPYIKDTKLEKLLYLKLKEGVKIELIISSNTLESDKEKMEGMIKKGIKISVMKKPKLHSKGFLIDNKYLYIGSINFSNYSIDNNRELGLFLVDTKIIKHYLDLFNNDFINNNIY